MSRNTAYLTVLVAFFVGGVVVMMLGWLQFEEDMTFSYSQTQQQEIKNIKARRDLLKNLEEDPSYLEHTSGDESSFFEPSDSN